MFCLCCVCTCVCLFTYVFGGLLTNIFAFVGMYVHIYVFNCVFVRCRGRKIILAFCIQHNESLFMFMKGDEGVRGTFSSHF